MAKREIMKTTKKFKKGDVLEIIWLDSHSVGGWKTPYEVKEWIERAKTNFIINTIGYFWQEDENFLRIVQSYDKQNLNSEGQGDSNVDNIFAIAKTAIKSIKIIKNNK